jgi:hypothetical protein
MEPGCWLLETECLAFCLQLHPICQLINDVIEIGIYSHFVQTHIAPTGYVKIPTVSRPQITEGVFLRRFVTVRL